MRTAAEQLTLKNSNIKVACEISLFMKNSENFDYRCHGNSEEFQIVFEVTTAFRKSILSNYAYKYRVHDLQRYHFIKVSLDLSCHIHTNTSI